ncbi:MAG: hypothetical protein QOG84_1962 [Sphingomonadales bacterium]|jgi:hypothetical protein|nr:hypothetical protein [Sphingomonadales bacterium]
MNDQPSIAVGAPEPITPLTDAEKRVIAWLNENSSREAVLADLQDTLQTAIEIELATIPIYLFTYYSINREAASGENLEAPQLFANKAGAVIMSVAVEEMLHMSLSSNVLFALGGTPRHYRRAPGQYPTPLPYHNPVGPKGPDGQTAVLIPLSKLSFEQLWHFLQIEYPEAKDVTPEDRDWDTIGQFYSFIRCLLCTKFLSDADFQRGPAERGIQPGNYSPNNIDTVFPKEKFDPWKTAPPVPLPGWLAKDGHPRAAEIAQFTDCADSHTGPSALLTIATVRKAIKAIDTVCDQGEGAPICGPKVDPDDDLSSLEMSHYQKFLTLQAQFAAYKDTKEDLPPYSDRVAPVEPTVTQSELEAAGLIYNFPDNPTTGIYPIHLWPISAFTSACFQYMLIMTETIYRVPPHQQKLFFNEGLHRSMIWVLDKYIKTIRKIPVGGGKVMAPTFENVDLGPPVTAFAGLTYYGNQAIAAANAILAADPNGPLASVMSDVIYYIGVAISATSADGHPMHLPDVAEYWSEEEA